ncbi:MAG: cupin domain-containing protein [Deltaproteobacteria bacterium]|nr:cupin domain-containing protein [Deltaproteobacteria bacterium]MCL5879737.1 cupin domain-containing protein [Deltaproteobacteria bacterium]MDA8304166.1 cupin domain-containing protein [Deltaproteobacteria bacterium]
MDDYFHSLKDIKPKEPVKGISIRSVYLEKAMLTRMEFEPGSVIPEHRHPHEQITYILEGKMDMIVDGVEKTVSMGDAVTIPSNVLHSARIPDEFTVAVDAWSPVRDDYK